MTTETIKQTALRPTKSNSNDGMFGIPFEYEAIVRDCARAARKVMELQGKATNGMIVEKEILARYSLEPTK